MDRCLETLNIKTLSAKLNCPFSYQPSDIMLTVVDDVRKDIERQADWGEKVAKGKMFGVLIVRDADGRVGYLKAYSGQIGGREDWDGWVPAVFDYLQPDGYFVTHEAEISQINRTIAELERSPRLIMAAARLAKAQKEAEEKIEGYRRFVAKQKAIRSQRRLQGEDEAVLVAEIQYQKAELRDETKRQSVDRITLKPKPQSLSVVKPTGTEYLLHREGSCRNGLSLSCH